MSSRRSPRFLSVISRCLRSAGPWVPILVLGGLPAPDAAEAQTQQPALSIGDTFVVEGDAGTSNARFLVTVSPPPEQTVSVVWATSDGSARAGADYRPREGTLLFEPGQSSLPIDIPVLGDTIPEDDETFFVDLLDATGAVVVDSRGRAVIEDDDSRPIGIERVGEAERSGREGDVLELEVRVTDEETGDPVARAQVTWEVRGNATPVGPPGSQAVTTLTNGSGVATLQVGLGAEGEARVTATLANGETVGFRIEIRGDVAPLFDPAEEPGPRSVAEVVDEACSDASQDLLPLCNYLFDLPDALARDAIRELTPREAAAMGILGREGARAQIGNVLRHLAAARRGGGTGIDDLALVVRGERLAAATFRPTVRDGWEPELRLAALVDAALQDPGEPSPIGEPLPEGVPRWSLFVSGQVSTGDREQTGRETGFDLETTGVTVGVDFQASPTWVLGLAGGWLDSGNDFVGDGGSLDVEGYSATLFAGFAGESGWFDLVGSWGTNEYDLVRHLDLPGLSDRVTARGAPDGDQLAFATALGYDASFGATGIGLFARGSYVESTIDPFEETGAGAASLALEEQTLESLLSEAGLELTRAISTSWGVFLPQLRVAWLHEFEDDARLIRGRFVADRSFLEFVVPTDVPDADYFNAGVGFTATFVRGWSAYLFADRDLERDDLDLTTVSGGFRVEL